MSDGENKSKLGSSSIRPPQLAASIYVSATANVAVSCAEYHYQANGGGEIAQERWAHLCTFDEIANHLAHEGKTAADLTETFVKSGGGTSPGKNSIRITC
jgi:hypothetical protein